LATGYRYIDYLKDIKYLVLEYDGIAILTPVFNVINDIEGPLIELAFIIINDAAFINDV
jgi:hypothetical protein